MQIFNVQVFGVDKTNFLKLTTEQKKEWILKNTNQKNETLIDEFIKKIPLNIEVKDAECLTCKEKKNDSNKRKGNVKEAANSGEKEVVTDESTGNDTI